MNKSLKIIVFVLNIFFSSISFAGSYEDFFTAIRYDQPARVMGLLTRGFDPDTLNPDGIHGLFLAITLDSPKSASTLIQWPKTQVEWRNARDESPLMMASIKGQLELVKQLIARDADVNKTGWTPLHYAASGGQSAVLEELLEHSAYIDAESPNGTTPLMMAAMYGNAEGVRILLDAGADPMLRNQLDLNAADFAKRAGRDDSLVLIDLAVKQWGKPKSLIPSK